MRRVTGLEYDFVKLLMVINVWWIGAKAYKDPIKSAKTVSALLRVLKTMFEGKEFVRSFKINNKYVWDLFNPAWPSTAFNSFFTSRLHEVESISENHTSLRRVLVAITKKCPLQCEHCSESETLYQKDKLSYLELEDKINYYVQKGVGQLVYSGGEPLSRFDVLEKLISRFTKSCDQWIYTSGFGLSVHKAEALKKAGLNGCAISLDHHLENHHNKFRGNDKSFYWVLESIKNCQNAGIVTALNLCPTQDYINTFDVEDYIHLARKLQVPFINIIEPQPVGNYLGKNVTLTSRHREVLLKLSHKYNFSKSMVHFPTVVYPAAFGKSLPCGGGKSYLHMDFDGKISACPFCKGDVLLCKTRQD